MRAGRLLTALGIGLVVTAGLSAGAYLLHEAGAPGFARILFWQNTLLQSAVPALNIGTPDSPVYEGTPLNYLAFLASFPVGFLVHSAITYYWLVARPPR